MISIIWQFEVAAGVEAEFEKHYGPQGTWVQLFRRDPAFRGTLLLRDRESPNRYLTVDRWNDFASYEAFRAKYANEYQRTDSEMEQLTTNEQRIGVFEGDLTAQ